MNNGDTRSGTSSLAERLAAVVARDLADLVERPLPSGLYLVATPIGHLGDLTLRALATLATVDRIYCEDTRHSLRLLGHFGIDRPLSPYHEHNAAAVRPRVLADLKAGLRLALISDAGTPLVSDPGFKLVRDVIDAGFLVLSLPGASSVLTALTSSGLPTDSFHFAGFLPVRSGQRRNRLTALANVAATLVLFEAPTRVGAALADIDAVLPGRRVVLARELTKLHETVLRGTPIELARQFEAQGARGECVVLIEGGGMIATEVDDAAILAALQSELAEPVPLSEAARRISAVFGVARSHVYELGLTLRRKETGS